MRVQLEAIRPDERSSFKILLTPNLNDLFYWHFHPEYEMVYVEAAHGIRHVGDHISRYQDSDLVFIGPHIPHLNFDYGVKTACEQVVVQMKEEFLGQTFLGLPELRAIRELFERARSGLAFHGQTKQEVGDRLKRLSGLDHFQQLMELLQIFNRLALSTEVEPLRARPLSSNSQLREQQRLQTIYQYIENHYQQSLDVHHVAELTHLSTAAFCRYFKKATHQTFTEFVNQYRINQAKKLLLSGRNVTEACFESGFENLSHFNRTFRKFTGENPSLFRRRHRPAA
ncbi:MAG TPA: AraC family transcriptional regulator [Chitinophagaceae bacterium]|nr:AraC family transcriptional regulator [Chitinophagaceae bacterium]